MKEFLRCNCGQLAKSGNKSLKSLLKRPRSLGLTKHSYIDRNEVNFRNPVKNFLIDKDSVISEKPKKRKYLTDEELILFFSNFNNDKMLDFAKLQFLCAARVSEIAGLRIENIDLKNGSFKIQHVVSWSRGKKVLEIKDKPKNGVIKHVKISNIDVEKILRKHIGDRDSGFLFEVDGSPLSYRSIQHCYSSAKKKSRITDVEGCTHILRHTAATITRSNLNLDAAQALTGHKSIKQIQEYAQVDPKLQSLAQDELTKLISQL